MVGNSCRNCIYEVWAVGIGQGVFCTCEANIGKNLGHRQWRGKYPLIPTKDFICEHYIQEGCKQNEMPDV